MPPVLVLVLLSFVLEYMPPVLGGRGAGRTRGAAAGRWEFWSGSFGVGVGAGAGVRSRCR
jgi:hypothetical protein